VSLFAIAPLRPEARGEKAGYQPGFVSWRSADGAFGSWDLQGTTIVQGGLLVDFSTAPTETDPYAPGAYRGRNYYNGGSYQVGQAVSPEVPLTIPMEEAIASWNAETPPGTWIEMSMRASNGSRWTKWYNLGIWASDTTTVERHSVPLQGDADGFVAIDTLVLGKKFVTTALQLKVRLFAATADATPTLRNVGLTYSAAPKKADASSGDPSLWNVALDVPECSQMVYPDGGTVWCSPTSTSMVLAYWNADTGPCEPRVRAAVSGVYDWAFSGYGNWPFNTAYAAASGLDAYVVRFSSMAQLEPWVKAGVPVVISYAWKGDLTGAPLSSSAGHLAVIVGFDESGNPIVNDPAAANDGDVQRVYLRSELESLWLTHSGGTTYVIFPPGHNVPAL
jgi:hypothetical protein